MKTATYWPLLVAASLVLSGCAEEPPPPEPQTDAEAIQYWLDAARSGELGQSSDEQIHVLERALARGTVLRSDINEIMPSYLDCLDAAGFEYYVGEEEAVPGSGISIPSVSIVVPSDGDTDSIATLADACGSEHQAYVASAYSNQPTSLEAQDRIWVGEEMRTCLAERGYTIDQKATAAEIREVWDEDITANIDSPDFHVC